MRAKNIEDILSLYTEDATFTDPDGKTFSTPDGLRQMYQQVFTTSDADLNFTIKDLNVKYDGSLASTAVEADSYEEVLLKRDTKTIQKSCGECIFTWQRQSDGQWLISSQKWTSRPCSAAPVI